MPELPEVETYRKKLEKSLKGTKVTVAPDQITFGGKSPSKVKKAFVGMKVKRCGRKGKYLWFEADKKTWPVFHLGMTGSFLITKEAEPDFKKKCVKLILELDDGTFIVYRDPRRFGRIFLLDDALTKAPLKSLGPDVMRELPSASALRKMLENKKAPIKTLLMDQSRLSGIGNWMADEILFQAKINPLRVAGTLTSKEIIRLRSKIKSVTNLAVRVSADDSKYPKTWIFHHRWKKKGEAVSTGETIKHSVVGGRSTSWVPSKQK